MAVDVKRVQGRRQVVFGSFDELLADAEALVAGPKVRTLGNWPLDQLLMHLGNAMNLSIDGMPVKGPWYFRLAGPLIKRHVLRRGMSPGFKLPRESETRSFSAAGSNEAALEVFRRAIGRVKTERMTAVHPVLGRLTHEEWGRLHLRHGELHLSFACLE